MTADSHARFQVIKFIVRNATLFKIPFIGSVAGHRGKRRMRERGQVWGSNKFHILPASFGPARTLVNWVCRTARGSRIQNRRPVGAKQSVYRLSGFFNVTEFGVFYGSQCQLKTVDQDSSAASVVRVIGVQTRVFGCRLSRTKAGGLRICKHELPVFCKMCARMHTYFVYIELRFGWQPWSEKADVVDSSTYLRLESNI